MAALALRTSMRQPLAAPNRQPRSVSPEEAMTSSRRQVARAASLVMIAFSLPMTFMSLIGGALADRIHRKYTIMTSLSGNIVITALLATLD